jgi:hypothetical protein
VMRASAMSLTSCAAVVEPFVKGVVPHNPRDHRLVGWILDLGIRLLRYE